MFWQKWLEKAQIYHSVNIEANTRNMYLKTMLLFVLKINGTVDDTLFSLFYLIATINILFLQSVYPEFLIINRFP